MRVRVLAFARLRELLGGGVHDLEVASPATLADVWRALEGRCAQISDLASSTRLARNGRIAEPGAAVSEGDEIALLPPVGGG